MKRDKERSAINNHTWAKNDVVGVPIPVLLMCIIAAVALVVFTHRYGQREVVHQLVKDDTFADALYATPVRLHHPIEIKLENGRSFLQSRPASSEWIVQATRKKLNVSNHVHDPPAPEPVGQYTAKGWFWGEVEISNTLEGKVTFQAKNGVMTSASHYVPKDSDYVLRSSILEKTEVRRSEQLFATTNGFYTKREYLFQLFLCNSSKCACFAETPTRSHDDSFIYIRPETGQLMSGSGAVIVASKCGVVNR